MACLSCPCFLDNNKTCSLRRSQRRLLLQVFTIATRIRDVEGRSEACAMKIQSQLTLTCETHNYLMNFVQRCLFKYNGWIVSCTCRACFSSARSLSIAAEGSFYVKVILSSRFSKTTTAQSLLELSFLPLGATCRRPCCNPYQL